MKFPMDHSSFEGQANRGGLLQDPHCRAAESWADGVASGVCAGTQGASMSWPVTRDGKIKKPEVQWGWNWLNWFKMVKQMDKSHFKWFNMFF